MDDVDQLRDVIASMERAMVGMADAHGSLTLELRAVERERNFYQKQTQMLAAELVKQTGPSSPDDSSDPDTP